MAVIASWGATQFVVEPHLIKSFSDLSISGSCDTEEKELGGQKYVEMKSAQGAEVSMTVEFNALTGHQNVMWEATQFVHMARWGTAYYLYLGNTKLIPAKMMLTKTKISKVVVAPGRGDEWISCSLDLTFQQADADDGTEIVEESGGGGGGGESGPYTARIYYSTSSGAVQSVYATSTKSQADANAKAKAKVPGNALWSGTKKQSTQTQTPYTEKGLEAARNRAKQTSSAMKSSTNKTTTVAQTDAKKQAIKNKATNANSAKGGKKGTQ